MDVLVLIDKLDDLVHQAKAVPLTDQVRIDREEIWEILDQMRATIPEEIKQARWIVKERQEMLAEAKREAERIVGDARDKAAEEASEQEVVKRAEREAADILEEARQRERLARLQALREEAAGRADFLHRKAEQAERVANKIDAGMVYVNIVGADGAELPFGGVKRSGSGRELGKYGADEFVNKKLIRVG